MVNILFDAQMEELPQNPYWIYSFWNGLQRKTQLKVLWLTANCSSVQRIAVYREPGKWNTPSEGTYTLCDKNVIVVTMWT